MLKDEVLSKVDRLIQLYRDGRLGGEKMPEYCPIDIHTPMWLWSRGKFTVALS